RNSVPITPRSSAVSFYGGAVPAEPGILMDLRRMNRILEVDPKDRKVKVEPGVTWSMVQCELEKQGMMVASPLLPHRDKSVLTSTMEREPMLIIKSEYNENFMTGEVVTGRGELFWLGTALSRGMVGRSNPEAFILGTKMFRGQQGTLGIVTWANIKAEYLPVKDKLFFIPSIKPEDIAPPIYASQRLMIGGELFVLNRFNLASILSQVGLGDFSALRRELPPFVTVIVLSGQKRMPEKRIEYEEEALLAVADRFNVTVSQSLAGMKGVDQKVLGLLRKPWPGERYWKFYPKSGFCDIFFHAPLNRSPEFIGAMAAVASKYGYDEQDIGIYLQPVERARVAYQCFTFHYDPADPAEKERVESLYLEASRAVLDMGGLFTNPYGAWAGMVFGRATGYVKVLRAVKNAFDPHNILNPGKLCF
ncbi:MAG: FAD-binding oxidoreductase, partial [Dehalococcoidia bacterium]|nr:FAD-binding oxidoreductase [Dehalococcoidia bacterium]